VNKDERMSGPQIARRGLMLVLSSPSGAGKTTISRALLADDPELSLSVSVTTRPPRSGEVHGKDYYFVPVAEYERMVHAGELLEHARVFDNYYGTPKAHVQRVLSAGKDILFDIDWQGTQALRASTRGDLVSIFILPPSHAELERRLRARAQDPDDVVARRMARAADEMSHWSEYDYVIVNSDIDRSIAQVKAILAAERLRGSRQPGLLEFVNDLRGVE
jgi:guanylate kinase